MNLRDLLKELGQTEIPDNHMQQIYKKLGDAEKKGSIVKRSRKNDTWSWILGSPDYQTVKNMMTQYITDHMTVQTNASPAAEPTSSAATASGHKLQDLLRQMGYPESKREDGKATFAPVGLTPRDGYLTGIHDMLREMGITRNKDGDGDGGKTKEYYVKEQDVERVKKAIKEYMDEEEAKGPKRFNKKKAPATFQIFVKAASGNTITLNVKASDTINTIKTKIQAKEHTTADNRLMTGTDLEGSRTLADYGITAQSTLFELPRNLGGAPKLQPPTPDEDTIESNRNSIKLIDRTLIYRLNRIELN